MVEKALCLIIPGPIKGGKNNMVVLRNGMHIPKKSWASWRDGMVLLLKGQNRLKVVFTEPCRIMVRYWKPDLRRRDAAAMIDSICHLLERSGVVADDCLLENWTFLHEGLDRERPRAEITITTKDSTVDANPSTWGS